MLGKKFNYADWEVHEGGSPYLFGYPDDDCPEASPYYWWFQYLKRNVDYLACCERGGEGKHAKLYLDWGDVRTDDFIEWFDAYGTGLFREPHVPSKLTEIRDASDLEGIDWQSVLVISSPLYVGSKMLSKRDLKHQFSIMVDAKFPDRRRGRPAFVSKAKYQIVGYPNRKALKELIYVYDLHKAEPKLTYWKIGERLHKEGKMKFTEAALNEISSPRNGIVARNIMTATISRCLKNADAYITTSTGLFFPVKRAGGV